MANSPADSNPIDRLSNLPDALLVTILSFLSTRIAARTSVLCRRFRHLWEASPSLALISKDFSDPRSDKFIAMAKRALLRRNPSHPLLSLRLDLSYTGQNARKMVSSFLAKALSLNLRHLTIDNYWFYDFSLILPIIFTINSLRCLSLDLQDFIFGVLEFPSGINLNCLRSLSLRLAAVDLADLNPLLSELCSLEDLHLDISGTPGLSLSSQTIRKLKLIITNRTQKLDIVRLSFPSLESLHLEIRYSLGNLSHIHAEVPLLRKAVINLRDIHERNVSTVAGLLNCISHVEELSLDIMESEVEKYPNPTPVLLESGKDVPKFYNLKHLDATLCFHKHNFEAVTRILHNCPVLKSLKLVHKIFMFIGRASGRKRKHWESKLPHNADGNNHYIFFKNLHLGEDSKDFKKLLRKKCTTKRQARK